MSKYEFLFFKVGRSAYCVSLIMVTITSHVFTNIFQTKHISAVKFLVGCKKNMTFLLISKSKKNFKKSHTKKKKKIRAEQTPVI